MISFKDHLEYRNQVCNSRLGKYYTDIRVHKVGIDNPQGM